jgi:hypothetical protein
MLLYSHMVKKEEAGSSVTVVPTYETTRCCNTEDNSHCFHHHEIPRFQLNFVSAAQVEISNEAPARPA